MPKKILYVAPTFPILTCTFIYREIFDLRDLGYDIDTVSMNKPSPGQISPEAEEFLSTTHYLDQVSKTRKFYSFFKALLIRPITICSCIRVFITANPMKTFGDYVRLGYHLVEACYLAFEFTDEKPDHIHCHFIAGSTSIGMFLSRILDVPFSFTMHASIIWIDPIALKTKLQSCKFCASISDYNKQYVLDTYGRELESKIRVVHCGIRLSDHEEEESTRIREKEQYTVLSVGQLVKRKGHHISVEAAKILKAERSDIKWIIVGEGELRPMLEKMIDKYGLTSDVTLVGAQPHEAISVYLDEADAFALPCVIGNDNTRDGIPVALMEAMASWVPVVSTNIVGLPELIESGTDGILLEPEDAEALADAIRGLVDSPDLRRRLADAARAKIDGEFNSKRSAEQLAELFQRTN